MLISFIKSIACLVFLILLLLPSFRNNIIQYVERIEHFLTKNKKAIILATLISYVSVTAFLQFYHWLDGDETQAWLIAKDSPSLRKMYTQMGYEGSPGLWHTILFPLAKFGVNWQVMYLLNHLFAITAIFLWLRFAPFPLFVRLLFPFIHVCLTVYPVYARSYALSICLLFAALALYKQYYHKWFLWSLAFILFANTNIPAALLTCSFALFLFLNRIFLKNKTDGKAMLLIGAGIALVCIQVYPPHDLSQELAEFKTQIQVSEIMGGLITGVQSLSIIIYIILIVAITLSLKSRFALYGFLAAQLTLFFLFIFKYPGALRHHFYLIFSGLMFLWVDDIKENKKNQLFILFSVIFLMMATTAVQWAIDSTKHYSTWKKEMANFINTRLQPDSTTFLACYKGNLSVSILPYTHIRSMYLVDESRWGSFITWNQQRSSSLFNPYSLQNVINLSRDHPGYKKYYYLTIYELPNDSLNYYRVELLKKTTNPYLASQWRTIYLYSLPEK